MTSGRRGPSRWQRAVDNLQDLLVGSGWPARLAHRVGFQRHLLLSRHSFPLLGYPDRAPPLRLAFASDFHAGPTTHPSLLAAAIAALADAEADMVLLGGDFVSVHARFIDTVAPLLAPIRAPLGKYAVLGNHDIWADADRIHAALGAAGVRVLVNENVRLPPPRSDIWVCGLDDHVAGAPDARATFAGAMGVRIVVMHAPSGLLDIAGHDFDLALCGHTHGGQVALPGGVPILVPEGRLSRRYARGHYVLCDRSGRSLLVSRGIGCSTIPVRLHSHPEIHVIDVGPPSLAARA